MPLPLYSLPTTTLSLISTKVGSMTKAAKTTLDVVRDNNHGLKKLVKGKYIWDRLFAYVSSIPFSDHDLEGQLY